MTADHSATSLHDWKALYRTGKLDTQVKSAPRIPGLAASATFVPVSVVPAVRRPQPAARPDAAVAEHVATAPDADDG